MGIPIILGASEKLKRTGGSFRAKCPQCGDVVKMHEAVKHTNVSAFLAISLWDGEDPVVQCGECLALFGDDDAARLRSSTPPPAPGLLSALTRPPTPKRAAIDEKEIDAELAALKKRLGK